MKKFLLAVLVDNKPGVLTHVSGLISRRAFNIESISAGYTEEADITRINIVVSVESEQELEQVVNQLSKLIDVIKIVNLSKVESIKRELVMIKVRSMERNSFDDPTASLSSTGRPFFRDALFGGKLWRAYRELDEKAKVLNIRLPWLVRL